MIINKQSVLEAIERANNDDALIKKYPSKYYDLVYETKRYPQNQIFSS